jgi:flagellar basal-body rod modification protein FlgD
MSYISNIGAGTTNTSSGANTLGSDTDKHVFLQLLVTQMRSQDPMNPMKNEDFLAQLAQFTSLENLQNIYEELSTSSLLQQSTHNALSTSLIGKYSLTTEQTVNVDGDRTGSAVYILPESGDVKITITDGEGSTVKTFLKTGLDRGEHLIDWDGKNEAGEKVADGTYKINVEYTSEGLTDRTISLFRVGRIRAVRFLGGSPIAVIDEAEYLLSDIVEVMESLPEES